MPAPMRVYLRTVVVRLPRLMLRLGEGPAPVACSCAGIRQPPCRRDRTSKWAVAAGGRGIPARLTAAGPKRVVAGCSVWRECCRAMADRMPSNRDKTPIEWAFTRIKAQRRASELRTIDKNEDVFGTVHDDFSTH